MVFSIKLFLFVHVIFECRLVLHEVWLDEELWWPFERRWLLPDDRNASSSLEVAIDIVTIVVQESENLLCFSKVADISLRVWSSWDESHSSPRFVSSGDQNEVNCFLVDVQKLLNNETTDERFYPMLQVMLSEFFSEGRVVVESVIIISFSKRSRSSNWERSGQIVVVREVERLRLEVSLEHRNRILGDLALLHLLLNLWFRVLRTWTRLPSKRFDLRC